MQRRPGVTVTLVHVLENDLGDSDVTTSTVIDGAIFEPDEQTSQDLDQAHPVYLQGAFNLPGVYTTAAGDTLLVGAAEWQVLAEGNVWLDRTRVPVAAGTFPDVVSLRVPGGTPGWSEASHRTEVIPFAPFATNVPARIQPIGGAAGNEPEVADDQVTVAGYRVSLPLTGVDGVDEIVVDGEQNTLIDVTASPDPLLIGKTIRVVDIVRGSHRFERTLLCTLND